jgi:hypothetical protein
VPIALTGTLTTGGAVPADLLAQATSTSSNPGVAGYTDGTIQAETAGQTTITISLRGVQTQVAVTVQAS